MSKNVFRMLRRANEATQKSEKITENNEKITVSLK